MYRWLKLFALACFAVAGLRVYAEGFIHDEHGCAGGKGHDPASEVFSPPRSAESVGAFAKPAVVSRTSWGCPDGQNSPEWTPQYTAVTHLVVHHSATANSSSDWAGVVRSIWNYHKFSNGWGDVGYNYLIDPNGNIYEGRAGGDNVIGAHFSCQNGGTMGVCILGSFTNVPPTSAALTSLKRLLAWKADQRGIDPLASVYHAGSRLTLPTICGHRDGNTSTTTCTTTTCPGGALYALLPDIRNDINDLIRTQTPVIPMVTTLAATNVSGYSARIRARIDNDGGATILERRFDWGTAQPLTLWTNGVIVSGTNFYFDLTGLTPGRTYFYRAWARNNVGWANDGILSFTTWPRLEARKQSGTIVVSWPTNAVGFQLWSSTNVGYTWQSMTTAPVVMSGKWALSNEVAEPTKIFRLAQ